MHSLPSLSRPVIPHGGNKHNLSSATSIPAATTMAVEAPQRLLVIYIISAQDLPPVSKMLRTFAVAYVAPDHKLTTQIDRHGHTNPAWNYRVAFHIDDRFLKHDSSAVTIEIYNLAWLRDLPVGTTRLLVNHLSPPLQRNTTPRRVALQICRPSGHLQGTLNVAVQLVDNSTAGVGPDGPTVFPTRNNEEECEARDVRISGQGMLKENEKEEEEEDHIQEHGKINNPGPQIMSKNDQEKINESMSLPTTPQSSALTSRPENEPETRTVIASCPDGSLISGMKPLPTEVAADLKKGFYSAEWNDFGSSIFEGWSDEKSDDRVVKSSILGPQWQPEDPIPLPASDHHIKKTSNHIAKRPAGRPDKKKGLMSCFGNAYGFQFSIICGSKNMKRNSKKKKNKNRNVVKVPDEENMRRFYV